MHVTSSPSGTIIMTAECSLFPHESHPEYTQQILNCFHTPYNYYVSECPTLYNTSDKVNPIGYTQVMILPHFHLIHNLATILRTEAYVTVTGILHNHSI